MGRTWTLLTLLLLVGCQSASRTPRIATGVAESPDGVPIVYDDRGDAVTSVVFIHCWACNRAFWRPHLDALADRYRVVSLDLAGHGASGANRDDWTLDSMAGDVQAVIETLELDRVILVGHSMGGPIALLAAARMPERVIGIVAVDTLHDADFSFPAALADQLAARLEADFYTTMTEAVPTMFPPTADRDVIAWVSSQAVLADRTAAVALIRSFSDFDMAAALAAVEVPIRCINSAPWAHGGMPTAIETNRRYADFDAVIIDGVGHYPMLEDPPTFRAGLRALIDAVAETH